MKKILLSLLLSIPTIIFSQKYDRGDFLITGGLGYPNAYAFTTESHIFHYTTPVDGPTNFETFKVASSPPSTFFRLELLADKRVSHALEFFYVYNKVSEEFERRDDSLDVYFPANFINQKMGCLYSLNFHYSRNTKRFDGFLTAGGGLSYRTQKGLPDFLESTANPFRLAFRIGWGMNYFLTKNIALNLMLRIGGPLISGGLTIKI